MKYLLKTTVVVNDSNYWVDENYIKNMIIESDSIESALKEYRTILVNTNCVGISENAMKKKSPMYIDTKDNKTIQTGYVIKGWMDFENNYKWVKKFVDLWVEILEVKNPFC